ncbi:transglutaminase family protein [Gloeocapsa sp. PCC 73106]|uniref:transglutaminase-like domain-containing protein n=1 Tax=Gloeocapsa sp. PCC 73106 TaxID=102232 RepID=UPI0002AC42B0|nr:transglutaminase family protein [Gloeocapsa sp. PCC 73106]ELS00015.1 transglutaminase-like enzyme, predicted cysteine protease [Gloeocapsa sp. PCC 73106]
MSTHLNPKFNCGCQLDYQVGEQSTFIFNIGVAKTHQQAIITESLELTPNLPYEEYIEPTLNNRFWRVNVLHQEKLRVNYQAEVELSYPNQKDFSQLPSFPLEELPLEIFKYIYPSRYCESDSFLSLTFEKFAHLPSGYPQVSAICDWIHNQVTYLVGSTDSQTSALQTFTEKQGVCRDFAHLGIAMCRALNIPARFVSGYAHQLIPPDFHAYFEVYLDHNWYLWDPTRLVPLDGLIRIGTGRDAADVSFATIFGDVNLENMKLWVTSL